MQQNSTYSEASSSSAQCGMCGSCGGMPPWAPEVIAKATPAQRQALDHRLSEARKRFIAARDARLAATKPITQKDESKLSSDDEKDTEINREFKDQLKPHPENIPEEQKPAPPTDATASKSRSVGKENRPAPDQHQQPQQPQHKTENQSKQSNVAVLKPENSRKSSAPVKQTNSLSASSLTELESDADSFHTADDEELDDKFEQVSTDLKNDGVTMNSDELRYMSIPIETDAGKTAFTEKRNPGHSVERYQASNSSNAPSQSPDKIPELVSFDDIDDNTNKESEWAPFQTQTIPRANTNNTMNANAAGPSNPITSASINPQTIAGENADSKMAIQELSPGSVGENVDTWTSDNLEQILLAQSSLQNRPRRPSTTAFNSRANDIVNGDSLRSRTELPVLTSPPSRHSDKDGRRGIQCADCQAWKSRVIQLEAKLESLSSSLAIREMEVATLKSQIDQAGRYVPKSEARLMQECESLRVTTEFLFQKLERYERSLNGRQGDVH